MEIFTEKLIHELVANFLSGLLSAWEFRGVFAEEALKLVFLPLHEFSIASCIVALGWIVIFWKNKGLFFSGVSHALHIAEWLTGVCKRAW